MHGKKNPSKTHNSQLWGPWSGWKWSTEDRQYYAERYDVRGNVEYTWQNGGAPVGNEHQYTPRFESPIGPLATDFGSVDINSAGYSPNQAVQCSKQGIVANEKAPDLSASPGYTTDPLCRGDHDDSRLHSFSQSHRDKGKEKASTKPHNLCNDQAYGRLGSLQAPTGNGFVQHEHSTHSHDPGLEQEPGLRETVTSFPNCNPGDTINSSCCPRQGTDYELEQALRLNRDEFSPGSGAGYDSVPIYPGTYTHNTHDSGLLDPTRSDFTEAMLGTPAMMELVDHRESNLRYLEHRPVALNITGFVVEKSYKFQPGEVFKVLWSEPTGQVGSEFPISDRRAMNGPRGPFYIGYRRFIIVTTDESHHSTCVPIMTYDRRGCGKKGVRPDKHGIIYDVGQKPKRLKDEPDLGFKPVPLKMYAEGETLAKESRVNYSKLTTIEHNVKVFFIGYIPAPYFDSVTSAVNQCWSQKMHKSSKKLRR
ncbi:hypothetical protein GGS21DRAFT_485811 [Xylaria nigripes]|nr:hypothetical protein GGS21DRAFT_485811 [Xylaria nigripes]